MPDPVPRPPKAPPDERIIPSPGGQIRIPPDFFPPNPGQVPEIPVPPEQIRRPPMVPPKPIIDRVT
jgi:hypothetical protein